ncbi:MAG: NAD(P)H-dependent oxidoreductase [Acidobacteria bacterium]|nr:NAD(P)H-dependent oxidoreductase [Acidobacteriota bacterium]
MRLIVCNGSPRGDAGNTRLMADAFLDGFLATPGQTVERFNLNTAKGLAAAVEAFPGADAVMLAFPLYTDAMPGIVKEFIEKLAPFKGREGNPRLLFLVQSGFPEASHCLPVKRYLEKLARRLGCPCDGVIRKGGGEGLRDSGPRKQEKARAPFRELGRQFAAGRAPDPALLKKLAGPPRIPRPLLRVVLWFVGKMAWDKELKRNGVFAERKARPYQAG